MPRALRFLVGAVPLALLCLWLRAGPGNARLFFSKSFQGSTPAYYEITVADDGASTYRESVDDDQPYQFTLAASETQALFALAKKLDYFQKPLESKHRVANLGAKVCRYEGNNARGEAKFNFSDDLSARALVDWFERIADTEQARAALERAAQFDKLGINKALLQVAVIWDKRRLVGAEQLLPLLDKIAADSNYMHMAQSRAASLAEAIRAGKANN